MIIQKEIAGTRRLLKRWREQRLTVSLVPTMGYFHLGHLALMKKTRSMSDKVVVSLFVNPAQFGPSEDLDNYPQDFEGDRAKAEAAEVDLLFCPEREIMYNPDHQTTVSVEGLSQTMCGVDRPVHFRGVATIVTKLFNVIAPDIAIFGEKDFQQLAIIRKLVGDLHFPIQIIGLETVREADGLAMSSRNAYLTSEERQLAPVLYRSLKTICETVRTASSVLETKPLLEEARQSIVRFPECSVDYLTIIDAYSLQEKSIVDGDCRAAGAIKINKRVRLIDNMRIVTSH